MNIVAQLYSELDKAGLRGVFAGGSARDTLHGVEPKDYDFVVTNECECDYAAHLLSDVESIVIQEIHPQAYGDTKRFGWCIKALIYDVPVDIIYCTLDPRTPQEVIDTFDFGINHCYFDTNGVVIKGPAFPAELGHNIVVLPNAELTKERTAKLAFKYSQYNWTDALLRSV